MTTVTRTTADRIRSFLKPAADSGLIPADEFRAVLGAVRDLAAGKIGAAPATPATPALLTLGQAAERLACSKKSVSRMIGRGQFRAVYLKPGAAKSLRVPAADVAALCGAPAAE